MIESKIMQDTRTDSLPWVQAVVQVVGPRHHEAGLQQPYAVDRRL